MPHTHSRLEHRDTSSLSLGELLGALSFAIDMTEGQPEGHCTRCCWIGQQIGQAVGLDEAALWDLYYAILLKDIGCSSNAARVCQLYLTDDLAFKRNIKTVDPSSVPQAFRFVFDHTGMGRKMGERLRALITAIRHSGEFAQELMDTRCQSGARIVRQMRFSEDVAQSVSSLDEHWDGRGMPHGLRGDAIPLYSRIALLAQVADVFFTTAGPAVARREIRRRSGTWFDPGLVRAFLRISATNAFWDMLGSPDLPRKVFRLAPARGRNAIDEDYLDDIAEAFAGVVDSKSPYTAGHSDRVAEFSAVLGRQLHMDASHIRRLKRAALLHDVGKLGVSNTILDKPGPLTDAEWGEVRRHTLYASQILSRIPAFSDIAVIARSHHERLDGTGYPDGLAGSNINSDTRLITVADVFDALTADRPYRAALKVDDALALMQADRGKAFDPQMLDALEAAIRAGELETAA